MVMIVFGKIVSDIVSELLLLVKIISMYCLCVLVKMKMCYNVEFIYYVFKNNLVE